MQRILEDLEFRPMAHFLQGMKGRSQESGSGVRLGWRMSCNSGLTPRLLAPDSFFSYCVTPITTKG